MVAVKWIPDPNQHRRKTLLRFSEGIRNSGVCAYPPLEAHLHEFYQKQKNPTSEPITPEEVDISTDTPTEEPKNESQDSRSTTQPEDLEQQIQGQLTKEVSEDITEGRKVLVIGTQYAISNVVPFPGNGEKDTPPAVQTPHNPDSPTIPKEEKQVPLPLSQVLDQQWKQLPAQARYEQNLYRLYMQKVMEKGDCSYPQLHQHIVQRYEAIHQDCSGRKMRWL